MSRRDAILTTKNKLRKNHGHQNHNGAGEGAQERKKKRGGLTGKIQKE